MAIAALPNTVKVISCFSVGFEHVDLESAQCRGLRVTNTPGVLSEATADIALLLMLGASRRPAEGERLLRSGKWIGLRPTLLLGVQITGKHLGIVGMGRIGEVFAERAQACGLTISYHNRRPAAGVRGAAFCRTLEELLQISDVLSLHCPLTPETKGLLNADRIAMLPRGAILIDTARGQLIEDDALITALLSGHVAATALNVFTNEPSLHFYYPTLPDVMLLPHLGSATLETRTAMSMIAIDNVQAVLSSNEPTYPVI